MMSLENENTTFEKFSEQATHRVNKYLDDVRRVLKDTDLTEEEIDESITELRIHIIDFCYLKSENEEIITTDVVSQAIKKLGEPKVIARTLNSELAFNMEVQHEMEDTKTEEGRREKINVRKFNLTANQMVLTQEFLSWVMTSILIFALFEIYSVIFYFPIVYGITLVQLFIVRRHPSFQKNNYLRRHMQLNVHILLGPIVFIYLYLNGPITDDFLFLVPVVLIFWLIMMTSSLGLDYFKILRSKIENKPIF